MPKKNKEDKKINDIIEIEEFPSDQEEIDEEQSSNVVKPKKSLKKPTKSPKDMRSKKKVEVNARRAVEDSESESESEEEVVKKHSSRSTRVKAPISQKRLDALQRGREKAAKMRAEKKKLEIDSLKKQLWDEFNGSSRAAGEAKMVPTKKEADVVQNNTAVLEHITKMKSSLPQEPLKFVDGIQIRSFRKIK